MWNDLQRSALVKSEKGRRCVPLLLHMKSWILRPTQKIIDGYMKIIGKGDQGFIIRLPFFRFIAADGILVHIQVESQSDLRDAPLFTQFSKSEHSTLLLADKNDT